MHAFTYIVLDESIARFTTDSQRPKFHFNTKMYGHNDGTSPAVAIDANRVMTPQQTGKLPGANTDVWPVMVWHAYQVQLFAINRLAQFQENTATQSP